MASFGLALPVLPGKQGVLLGAVESMRGRMPEFIESRRRAGLTMERSWLQKNPDGSELCVVYDEAEGGFPDVVRAFATGSDFDRWFFDVNQEITGIDFRQPMPPGSEPEMIASWQGASGPRLTGNAFAVPVVPGQTEAGLRFVREAYEVRKAELTESRTALGTVLERVFLNRTPMGDIIVVYVENPDLEREGVNFAASQAPFDRWFKDELKTIFPPFVDFDQPAPVNRLLWDWQAAAVAT